MPSAMETLLAVLPEVVPSTNGLVAEHAEQIKTQLKEMSWSCAEDAAALQTQLAPLRQQHSEAQHSLDEAKERERHIFAELESQANLLLKAEEELQSVQKEQQTLEDASRGDMLTGEVLRESKAANISTKEVFQCLLDGSWASEEEKAEKLQGLKDYLQSISTEKTLVLAAEGFGTRPEDRGEFDLMAIQCIEEELTQQLEKLQQQLLARQPSEKRMQAELAGLQALVEICEQKKQLAEKEHGEVETKLKEQQNKIKTCRLQVGRRAKAVEKFTEQLASCESKVAKIQEAMAAVDQLLVPTPEDVADVDAVTPEAMLEPAPASTAENAVTSEQPPLKRARVEEPKTEQRTRELQVASPARIRC